MKIRKPRRQLSWEDQRVRNWIKANWGILSKIAVECDVVPTFVQAVAYGNNHTAGISGPKVERALRANGWPGVRRKSL
jgi:hypothetical protein